MADLDHLKSDLDFVRSAVKRGRDDRGAAAIYFLWAAIIGIGFSLPDFAPQWAWWFWLVAGIGGGLLSMWLGYRDAERAGVRDVEQGRRHGWHWLATGAALAVPMLAMYSGKLPPAGGAPVVLAMVGLSYTLAGVHLNPPMRWAGAVMLVCSAALLFLSLPYLWTATGAAVALALVIGGVSALRAPAA